MRITNHTHYSTRDLRAYITRVCEDEGLGAERRRFLNVTIQYGRHHVGGYASIGGSRMTLRLPKTVEKRAEFAHIIRHEVGHLLGLRHRSMRGARYGWREGWRAFEGWTETQPLTVKTPVVKPRLVGADADAVKLDAARAKVAAWNRAVKRAQTFARKWTRKARYYERKLAAARAAKETP